MADSGVSSLGKSAAEVDGGDEKMVNRDEKRKHSDGSELVGELAKRPKGF